MAGEADAMLQALLAETNTLPQAALRDLVARGVILSVMTFEDHMNPKVHWIEPEEFGRAFDELTGGEEPMQTNETRAREVLGKEAGYGGPIPLEVDGHPIAVTTIAAIRAMLAFASPPAIEREGCPFCGSTDIGWTMLAGRKFAASYCQTCDARGPVVPFEMKREPIEETTAPAKAAWAKRASRPDEFRNVLRAFIESHQSPDPYVSYEMDMPVPDDRRDEQFAIDVALLDKTYALNSPTLHPSDREAIARVIEPTAFKSWQAMYDHCLKSKDSAETAKFYADKTHGPEIERALTKADAILALSGSLAPEGGEREPH